MGEIFNTKNNVFSSFKWDLPKEKVSEYKKIRIEVDSAYKWGRGWTAREATDYKSVVYPALEKAGFEVVESKDPGCSPTLYLKSKVSFPLNKRTPGFKKELEPHLYMHPMEYTGYLTKEDVDKVVAALNKECGHVCKAALVKCEDVYTISDKEYASLIMKRSKEIADAVLDTKNDFLIKYPDEAGFQFAREVRLPRLYDSDGYSSLDVDVSAVINIVTIAKQLGYFEKEKALEECGHDEADYEP